MYVQGPVLSTCVGSFCTWARKLGDAFVSREGEMVVKHSGFGFAACGGSCSALPKGVVVRRGSYHIRVAELAWHVHMPTTESLLSC